jgi:hypothetical protein
MLCVQEACCTLRDPLRDETGEVVRGLSLADKDGPLWAALLKTTVMC